MFFGVWSVSAQKTVSKTNWTLLDVDSEELVGDPGAATNAFDGDVGTFWHTDWANTQDPYPHYIVIDMGKSHDMIGFQYTPRGSGAGAPDTMSFWTSTDNLAWDSVAGGVWDADYGDVKTEAFTSTGQYIKFVGHSGQGATYYLTCAELDILVLGADFSADETKVMRGESVTFTDLSGNSPVAWEWIFEGGTPATSTDQNPTVTYNTAGNFDVTLISKPDAGDPTQNDTTLMSEYITVDIPSISQNDWSLIYTDSEEPSGEGAGNGMAIHTFDGDPSTYWHTQWNGIDTPLPYPHTIIIDLGATYDMEGFSYAPRPGGGNGTVDEYSFYVTKDLPSNTIDASWGDPVISGAWVSPWDVTRDVFFPTSQVGRYIVFYALSERGDGTFASCSELNVKGAIFGAAFSADKTDIWATQSVKFTDASSGVPLAWTWAFEGGDPATSADADPVVKYNTGGVFDVQMVMTPQGGATENDTLLKTDYINVKAIPSDKSMAKDSWSIVQFDSEEPTGEGAGNGQAIHAIDGDPDTYWHTAWAAQEDPYPHFLIIDLGENVDMVGFEYVPRPGGGNGTVAQYELTTSIDAETFTYADSGTWVAPWTDSRTQMFATPQTGRFVKFLAKQEKAGGAWASCGELNILVKISGVEFTSSETDLEKGGVVDFVDFSAGSPTGWQWTFEGGTPASSTEQSPSGIVYNGMGTFDVTLTTTGGTEAGTLTKTDLVSVSYRIPAVGANYVYIDTVEFGNAFSNYTTDTDGKYVHYTDMPIEVYRGESYELKVGHYNPWDEHDMRYQLVWIDWDNNGVLDADEQVMAAGIELGALDPVTIDIPADALLGETRMRVVGRYHTPGDVGNAYDGFSDGEVEDYTLVIADLSTDVPVADFSADAVSSCVGGAVQFTDLSTGTPTSWAWTFEGGEPATSEMRNPIVMFPAGGTYDVSLTATQVSGSDDEVKTDMITVHDVPTVSAGDDVNACYGADITLSGSGAVTYEWDNSVVDGTAFAAVTGTYAVTGTDANGCTATDTVEVTVEPMIDFTVTEGDESLTVDAAIGTLQWIDCSDNSDIAGETGSQFMPAETGDYAVVVTVGDCSATSVCFNVEVTGIENEFARSISIYPNPSTGMINIAIEKENATIKVYNTLGALVLEREKSADIEQIEISVKGIYIIRIESEMDIYTGKLVVE